MTNIRTATLEFLRHGPPHNQLLSPLTRYIAVCGNHPAETIEIPLEHGQLMARLRDLSYQARRDMPREFQAKDMAQFMSSVLAQVPGLIAELVEESQANELIHLRLVISASELALLPFELSNAPNGFPGAGQHLMLQSQMPICITREVRRASDTEFEWPGGPNKKPKILFAAASPPGVGEIPVESHLLVLREAIEPWVSYLDAADTDRRRKAVQEHLVFLPNASLRTIERECSHNDFTHVHILAHGIPAEKIEGDRKFGLALHDNLDDTQLQVVSGEELAAALRPFRAAPQEGLSRPTVVTVASCDSGNVGSVISGGASIAHALHEADVPLIIASQFPLTFGGSVLMTQVLYEQLLWGGDPRKVLTDLRRQLLSRSNGNHDWASIVAYASLPADLRQQLAKIEVVQSKHSINAVLKEADEIFEQGFLEQAETTTPRLSRDVRQRVLERIQPAKQRLQHYLTQIDKDHGDERNPDTSRTKIEINGLLGSTEKRQAQLIYPHDLAATKADAQCVEYQECQKALKNASDYYREGIECDPRRHWVTVQHLSLACVLDHFRGNETKMVDLWTLARITAEFDTKTGDLEALCWGHGSLIELYLLAVGMTELLIEQGMHAPWDKVQDKARIHTQRLIQAAPRNAFPILSTRRQMLRYCRWYSMPKKMRPSEVRELAEEIVLMLKRGI